MKTRMYFFLSFFVLSAEAKSFAEACKKIIVSLSGNNPPREAQQINAVPALEAFSYYLADRRNPLSLVETASKVHGPSFYFVGKKQTFVFGEADPTLKVLSETDNPQQLNYTRAPNQSRLLWPAMGKHNLLAESDGKRWRAMHDQLRLPFTPESFRQNQYFNKISSTVAARINRLKDAWALEEGRHAEVRVVSLFKQVALESFLRVMLNADPTDADLANLVNAGEVLSKGFGPQLFFPVKNPVHTMPAITSFQREQVAAVKTMRDYFTSLVQRNRELSEALRSPLMNALLALKVDGQAASDEHIVGHLTMFYVAANDTAGSALSSAIYQMAEKPEIQHKLLAGIQQLPSWSQESLNGLKYLDQILSETFRYMPSFYLMSRIAQKDLKIQTERGEVPVRKGDPVMVCPFLAGRHEKSWGVEKTGYPAHDYNPERFAGEVRPSAATHYGFGRGPRVCLAQHFAMQELKIIIALFTRDFKISPLVEGAPEPFRQSGTSLSYDFNLKLRFENRSP